MFASFVNNIKREYPTNLPNMGASKISLIRSISVRKREKQISEVHQTTVLTDKADKEYVENKSVQSAQSAVEKKESISSAV